MPLWIWLIGGVALAVAGVALFLAMASAERRARRTLFRALGLDEPTIQLLMARNGDVLAELALVRRAELAPDPRADAPAADAPSARGRPAIRLVHPAEDTPAAPPDDDRRSLPRRS
jgi:hypothetical protein